MQTPVHIEDLHISEFPKLSKIEFARYALHQFHSDSDTHYRIRSVSKDLHIALEAYNLGIRSLDRKERFRSLAIADVYGLCADIGISTQKGDERYPNSLAKILLKGESDYHVVEQLQLASNALNKAIKYALRENGSESMKLFRTSLEHMLEAEKFESWYRIRQGKE